MKSKRKFAIAVMTIAVIVLTLLALSSCNNEDNSDTRIVIIGDSIAEAVLGPSPITERENYGYFSVLGQVNGFTYNNRAVSGYQTSHLLKYISQEKDDTAYRHITLLKRADVIMVSILGNDFLQNGLSKKVLAAVENDFEEAEETLKESSKNINAIIARLKELNPDAELLIQTVYNPVFPESTLLSEKTKRILKEKYNKEGADIYALGKTLIDKLNGVLYDYLEEHPGAFRIVDVNKRFDELNSQDSKKLERLIYEDSIHPSDEGHAVIFSEYEKVFEELGYSDEKSVLKNYKNLRIAQAKKLYSDTEVNVKELTKKIKKAKNIDQVNDAYFDAIYGVTPVYLDKVDNTTPKKGDVFLAETAEYEMEEGNIVFLNGGSMLPLIDKEKTKVVLGSDGSVEITLVPNEKVWKTAVFAIAMGTLGLIDFSEINVDMVQPYITELFPGASMRDLQNLFEVFNTGLGLEIQGFNFESEQIKAITDSIKEDGYLPDTMVLPTEVKFGFRGHYTLKTLDSDTQEEPFTAAYVGEYTKNSDPFLIFTLYEKDGEQYLNIRNELLFLNVVCKKK